METKILYHLSKKHVELLVPRVPKSDYEDQVTPRICFAQSIQGCLIGINENKDLIGERFHVYSIETNDYYIPKKSEVADQEITGEVWITYACEPNYLYDIEVTGKSGEKMEEINDKYFMVPTWDYKIIEATLTEDNRTTLISKSRSAGEYKDKSKGKNRFERKKYSKIAKVVKEYNKIDMNKLFKEDTLIISIPVIGEKANYTVSVKMDGVVAEIARNIKANKNKLEYRTIVQALTKIFNTANIYVKCTCDDFKYRFAHWNIVNNVSVDDTAHDPGPGKGIANPHDDKGRGCKHILLALANGDWLMKVASVINNYIHYAEEHLQKPFLNVIFPKLYGMPFDAAVEKDLLPEEFNLQSTPDIIDAINEYGKNRGKYKQGSNKNPVTGTGGKTKKEISNKETSNEDSENTENK